MTAAKLPTIAMCPCESSRIAAHGFDPATGVLALQFKKKGPDGAMIPGNVYHYAGFSADDYKAFTESESLGKHFGQVISARDDEGNFRFPFTKIEPEAA